MTSYTRTLLTRYRERVNIFVSLQRISCVFAHRSNRAPPSSLGMRGNGHPQRAVAARRVGRHRAKKRPNPTRHAHMRPPNSRAAHTPPCSSRCSTSVVAHRQSTLEMVPVLRRQADAWVKVSGARKGPCARLSGECGRLVLTLCYRALQAAHLRAEATLLTPRVARSLRGAAGHCDSDGRRLEELRLLLDDLSCAMPASSGSERLERPRHHS